MDGEEPVLPGFEHVACQICGEVAYRVIARRSDVMLGGSEVFQMVECLNCSAVYQNPRPTPPRMADYYPAEYEQYTPAPHTESTYRLMFRRYGLRKRARAVGRLISGGRLLDVGCATGDFLTEMRGLVDWTAYGLEPNYTAVSYARSHAQVDGAQGLLNEPPFARGAFDAITMWDVLEHVYAPKQVIEQAAGLLRTGGMLIINHPNLDSIDRRLFGRLWLGYELPRHLTLFPSPLLNRLMADAGLVEVSRKCLYGSHAATSSSLMYVIASRVSSKRVHDISRKLLFSRLARVMVAPWFKMMDWLRVSSNVTVTFRKVG
jgi:SAM-dependent methyltransferase